MSAELVIVAETQRLILRHFALSDAEAMERVFCDAEVMLYGDGVRTPAAVRAWLRRWIEEHYHRRGFGMWAVVEKGDDRVVGYCGLSRFDERCGPGETEIGYRLARAVWGRGIATEAAAAVRDYALDVLRLPRLIAMIDPDNVASIRVAEKIGMRYERDVMLDGYTHPDRLYARSRATGG